MTEETKDTATPKAKKRPTWRVLVYTLLILSTLVGIVQYVFYYYAFPILKDKICNSVTINSKGLYTMDFNDFKINFLGRKLTIDNFRLSADTTVYLQRIETENYNKAIYNISVSKLIIDHIGIKSFFSQNELYIKQITMESPIVRLVGKPDKSKPTKAKYDAVHTDLYPLLKPYFNSLNIRNIVIKEGFFDFHLRILDHKQQFGISKINIRLQNFYLDEERFIRKNVFYYSDNIQIQSRNYVINMADSLHCITAELLTIDTKDSSIHAENVNLLSNPKIRTNKNRIDVSLKEIAIEGLDISRAYFQKEVDLTNVTIKQPTIKFIKGGIVNKKTKKFEPTSDDWYTLIKGTLRSISIDSLNIDGASIKLYKPQIKNKPIYSMGNVDVLLEGFLLDSLAYQNKNKILYSDNLSLVLNDFQLLLPDNRHQISADSLMVSTKTKAVYADKINIKPTRNFNDSTEKTMRISIPKLEINEIDFLKSYNEQNFEIGQLKISLPNISTKSYIDSTALAAGNNKQSGKTGKLLKAMSEEYFHSLKIKTLYINKGKVDITSKAFIRQDSLTLSGKLSLTIGNFVMNKSTINDEIIPFRTSRVKLNLEDAIIKPSKSIHTMRCGNFFIDTQNDKVSINNFSYTSDNDTNIVESLRRLKKSNLMDINVEHANFSKTELLEAIYHGKINIEKLKIVKPKFEMNLYPELKIRRDTIKHEIIPLDSAIVAMHDSILNKFNTIDRMLAKIIPWNFQLIKVDTLNADSSLITLIIRDSCNNITTQTSSDFHLGIIGFYFDRDSVATSPHFLLADDYNLDINNFQFALGDKVHIGHTDKIHIDTKKGEIDAKNVKIFPINDRINDRINEIKSKIQAYSPEIKISGIDFDNFGNTGFINIDSFNISNSEAMIEKIVGDKTKNPKDSLPKKKRKKLVKGLNIANFQSINNKVEMTDATGNKLMNIALDFSCKNLNIDSSNIVDNNRIVTFDSTYINSKDLLIRIKDNELTAKSIRQKNDTLKITNARFRNPDDTIRTNFFVPNAEIINPSLERTFFEHTLQADKIKINNPDLNFLLGQKKKKNRRDTTVKKTKFDFEVDSLQVDGITIHLDRRFKDKPDLWFPNMDLVATGINTATEHESAYPADKIVAGINNFTYLLKDSLYRFHFGRIELNPITQHFTARQMDYRPLTGRYEFWNQFDYRRSALYINAAKMEGDGFNLIQFIRTMKMDIRHLEVDKFAFNCYDNKTLPNDSTVKPNLHKYIFTKLPIKMKIDTTIVNNSLVQIEQLSPEVGTPGLMTINNIKGKIYNFINDSADLISNSNVRVVGSGMLMGQSKVKAHVLYDLASPTESFICNFFCDTINLPIINPFLENGIFARIDGGILQKGTVLFKSDDYESRGESQFLYRDLKFSLNKKDSVQEKRRGLLSLLANTMIRTKNTRKVGYIYAQPDSTRSFASYWMSSILSGAKSTVGFETKEQKDDRKIARKLLDAVTRKKNKQAYSLETKPEDESVL